MPQFQCVQFGVCSRADKAECFEINGDFKCGRDPEDPECQSKLEPISGGRKSSTGIKIGLSALAVILLGGVIFWLLRSPETPPAATTEQLLKEIWPWLP